MVIYFQICEKSLTDTFLVRFQNLRIGINQNKNVSLEKVALQRNVFFFFLTLEKRNILELSEAVTGVILYKKAFLDI